MQKTAFSGDYWDDRSLMDGQFFPVHARGMSKNNLTAPLARFVATVRGKVDELSLRFESAADGEATVDLVDELSLRFESVADGEVTVDLVAWTLSAFYDGTLAGFFGPKVLDARGTTRAELYRALETYDRAFPIIASGLIPLALVERIPDVKKAREAQHVLAATFADWIAGGFEGLEHGVVRSMAQVALDNNLGDYEAGKMLVADFWASMANAPFIAVRLLVTLLQAPEDLRDDLQREIDAAMSPVLSKGGKDEIPEMSFAYLAQSLPLLGSCITETLRLETSALSIRVVEKDIALTSDKYAPTQSTVIVPANSRLVNVTRMHHLNDAEWDGNASAWDGRRFFDGGNTAEADPVEGSEDPNRRSKRAREVYGFGGGISRVSLVFAAVSVARSRTHPSLLDTLAVRRAVHVRGFSADCTGALWHLEALKFADVIGCAAPPPSSKCWSQSCFTVLTLRSTSIRSLPRLKSCSGPSSSRTARV